MDEKLKKLRKRNADLVALAKQLDERCKSLKQENEQLVRMSESHHIAVASELLKSPITS